MTLAERLALAVYGAVTTLAQPLLRRKLRKRGQVEPGYLEAVEERKRRAAAVHHARTCSRVGASGTGVR